MSKTEVPTTTAAATIQSAPKKHSFTLAPQRTPTTAPAILPPRGFVTTGPPKTPSVTTAVVTPQQQQQQQQATAQQQQQRKHSFIHTPNVPQAPANPQQMIQAITSFNSEAHRLQAIRSAHHWVSSAPAAVHAQIGAPKHDEIERFTQRVLHGLQNKSDWKQLEEDSEKDPFRPLRWLLFATFGSVHVKTYEMVLRWLGMPDNVSIETTVTYRNTVVEAVKMGSLHLKDVEWRITTTAAQTTTATTTPTQPIPKAAESVKTVIEVKTVEVIVEKEVEKSLSNRAIELLERLYTQTESDEENDVVALARELNVSLKTQRFLHAWEAQRKLTANEDRHAAMVNICKEFEGVRCIEENLPSLYEGLLNWKREHLHS